MLSKREEKTAPYEQTFQKVKDTFSLGFGNAGEGNAYGYSSLYVARAIQATFRPVLLRHQGYLALSPNLQHISERLSSAILSNLAQCGNCYECSAVSLIALLKSGFKHSLELVLAINAQKDNHAFVILDRDENDNIKKPARWKEGVLFDTWDNRDFLQVGDKNFPKDIDELTKVEDPALKIIVRLEKNLTAKEWLKLNKILDVFAKFIEENSIEEIVKKECEKDKKASNFKLLPHEFGINFDKLKRLILKEIEKEKTEYDFQYRTQINPTSTILLLNQFGLKFTGYRDEGYNVDAVCPMETLKDLKKAAVLTKFCETARFFNSPDGKPLFVLPQVNSSEVSEPLRKNVLGSC